METGAAYHRLGVSKHASMREIKKAYHKQILTWHPDKNTNDPRAKDIFAKVKEAYDLIKATWPIKSEHRAETSSTYVHKESPRPESDSGSEASSSDKEWWGSDDDWGRRGPEDQKPNDRSTYVHKESPRPESDSGSEASSSDKEWLVASAAI